MVIIDLLRWIAETSLAAGLLIVVILIIRKPFAKLFGARAAYALWLAPVLRVFLPELAVLPPPEAIFTGDNAWEMIATPVSADIGGIASGYDARTVAAVLAVFLWFTIGFAWFNLKIEAQSRFMRVMLASSKPAASQIMLCADAIQHSLGVKRRARIRLCNENYGPAVIGLFRPVIFLPANFLTDYSAEERRLALAHEIAHIARGDMAATLAALMFQAVQWPNPLVHFAFRLFRTDQEAACDAYVLSRFQPDPRAAGDYASAIIKSAAGAQASPAFGLSLGHPVKERLMLLKNPKQSPLRKITGGASAIALVLAGLAATASYGFAADEVKEDGVVKKEKRVMIIGGGENEDGVVKKEERVIIMGGDDDMNFVMPMVHDGDYEFITEDGDSEHRIFKYVTKDGHGPHMKMMGGGDCTGTDGEGEPVKLEWSDEADEDGGMKTHSIICVAGEEDPKKRAEALRKAIDQMEERHKQQQARHKKMIAGLRKQLRELEKK